jgi:hypothetical protein
MAAATQGRALIYPQIAQVIVDSSILSTNSKLIEVKKNE